MVDLRMTGAGRIGALEIALRELRQTQPRGIDRDWLGGSGLAAARLVDARTLETVTPKQGLEHPHPAAAGFAAGEVFTDQPQSGKTWPNPN
ncbi:MAG: hypothetical protein R3D78_10085 [Paracoccaceae bacterium]